MTADFGWPRAVPSMAFALQYIGGGLGGVLMGWIFDRRGMGIPALSMASFIGGGALLVSVISAAPWQLHSISVVVGFMGLSARTQLVPNIMRWFDKKSWVRSHPFGDRSPMPHVVDSYVGLRKSFGQPRVWRCLKSWFG